MADENNISSESDSVSTSASDPGVELTDQEVSPEESETNPLDDWAKPEIAPTDDGEKKTVVEKPETDKETKPEAKKDEKPADDKSDEDQILEELLSDDSDDDADSDDSGKETKKEGDEKEPNKEEDDEKDELDKADPEKMIDGQRNVSARAWAERRHRYAKITDAFRFSTTPIEEVAKQFEELNSKRYSEFSMHAAHALVDENPNGAFQRAYVVAKLAQDPKFDYKNAEIPTLESILNAPVATGDKSATTGTATAVTDDEIKSLTADLDALGDWRNEEELYDDREKALVQTIKAMEERLKTAAPTAAGPTEREKQLEERLAQYESKEQTDAQKAAAAEFETEVMKVKSSIESKVLPMFLKNAGLDIDPNDTAEIKAFKETQRVLYNGTEHERANGLSSRFEEFAFHESTVKADLNTVLDRIIEEKANELEARHAGNEAQAKKHADQIAEDTRDVLNPMLVKAHKEFKAKYITPAFAVLGLQSASPAEKASKRVEVIGGGEAAGKGKKSYESATSAGDVWGSMVSDAEEEEKLRAAA